MEQIQTHGAGGPSVTVKAEKGMAGKYGWTLGATVAPEAGQSLDDAFRAAIDALNTADGAMRRLFGAPPADLTVTPTRVA